MWKFIQRYVALVSLAILPAIAIRAESGDGKVPLVIGDTKIVNVQADPKARNRFGIGSDGELKTKAGQQLRAYLTEHFTATRKFTALEREAAKELRQEAGATTEAGTADYMVFGTVLNLVLKTQVSGGKVGSTKKGVGKGIVDQLIPKDLSKLVPDFEYDTSKETTTALIEIQLRVVNTRNQKDIAAVRRKAEGTVESLASSYGVSVAGVGGGKGKAAADDNLVWPLFEAISKELAVDLLADAFPIQIVAVDDDGRFIIDYGAPVVNVGQELQVRSPAREIPGADGKPVRLSGKDLGIVSVVEADPEHPVSFSQAKTGNEAMRAALEKKAGALICHPTGRAK